MTKSIQVLDDFLPTDVFELLASNIMEVDGYKCLDFAVREDEVDGSKYQFGNINPNPNSKIHESSATFILFQNDVNPKRDVITFEEIPRASQRKEPTPDTNTAI